MILKKSGSPFIAALAFFLLTVFGCAHPTCELKYPFEYKTDPNDDVSIATTLDLAVSSYIAGCMNTFSKPIPKGTFDSCQKKAHEHVRDNVVFILDQQGTPGPLGY